MDPRSAYWIPPVGGGHHVELVRDDQAAAALSWETGTNNRIELPVLEADATPLALGDWLTVITPLMRDISQVSAIWWERTKGHAVDLYNKWRMSTPLDRVGINPVLPEDIRDARFQRTEQRGTSLLLKAIPVDQQQALIAAREMNSCAIIYRLLVRFQPGGSGEKTLLLQKLTALDDATNMQTLSVAVRSWRRYYTRANEVGATIPDGTLLLQALEKGVQMVAACDSQAAFRLAQSRSQLGVDERPDHNTLWRFSQCLLAEAESLALLHPAQKVPTTPNVRQLGTPSQTTSTSSSPMKPGAPEAPPGSKDGKGTGNADKPCRYFITENGCKAGKTCKFLHSWEGVADKASRCWICGATAHRKVECPVRANGNKPSPPGGGSGSGEVAMMDMEMAEVEVVTTQATSGVLHLEVVASPLHLEVEVVEEQQRPLRQQAWVRVTNRPPQTSQLSMKSRWPGRKMHRLVEEPQRLVLVIYFWRQPNC
eukprot:Skav223477  [mRNA]  locus=scaffold659:130488:131933:+ [translate_table: standard]